MAPSDQHAPGAIASGGAGIRSAGRQRPVRPAEVQCYRVADEFSGFVICLMVVFSPWAFGTTQPWSIGIMNLAGYGLGVVLAFKLFIRHVRGYRPLRWAGGQQGRQDVAKAHPSRAEGHHRPIHPRSGLLSWLVPRATPVLGVLTLLMLAFCLVSAANARATYHRAAQSFEYHDCIRWLPHSLDSAKSWQVFWNYLAIACAFWALRDWLLGRTLAEERHAAGRPQGEPSHARHLLPARLRLFLWLLCLNGTLLGIESIAQRVEGSGKLLFLVKPRVNPEAVSQFGPWAYRSNAAQYFNLLWPVCLGFWWTLHRAGGFQRQRHHLLLPCAAIMAACPIISTSRGGAVVSVAILLLAFVFLVATELFLFASRQVDQGARRKTSGVLVVFCAGALGLGYYYGWKPLAPRMAQFHEGIEDRETMFENARPMTRDYPWFGTGPGSFESVFQLYRASTETYWPAQLHNDWLETRITFGWVGLGLVLLALGCVVLRWYAPGGIHGGRRFITLSWLALAGGLAHARFDFPFQIYSTLFLFTTVCGVLITLTRRP